MKKIITHAILTKNMLWYEIIRRKDYLPTKKRFLSKLTLPNTRKIKFVNFKMPFAQFHRKITGYADMLMKYRNICFINIKKTKYITSKTTNRRLNDKYILL